MARVWAAIGVCASLLGTLDLAFATRGGPGITGYVSESGVAGAPHALAYRLALLILVVATGAAALTLRGPARLAASVLGIAVPFLLVSSAARCSAGCPLPPFQRPTAGDLLHAGASIVAVGRCRPGTPPTPSRTLNCATSGRSTPRRPATCKPIGP